MVRQMAAIGLGIATPALLTACALAHSVSQPIQISHSEDSLTYAPSRQQLGALSVAGPGGWKVVHGAPPVCGGSPNTLYVWTTNHLDVGDCLALGLSVRRQGARAVLECLTGGIAHIFAAGPPALIGRMQHPSADIDVVQGRKAETVLRVWGSSASTVREVLTSVMLTGNDCD